MIRRRRRTDRPIAHSDDVAFLIPQESQAIWEVIEFFYGSAWSGYTVSREGNNIIITVTPDDPEEES